MNLPQTLGEFVIAHQREFPYATGELTQLLSAIRLASKVVNQEINKAGLTNILGTAGEENVQGEKQMKLDVFANELFIKTIEARGLVGGLASEEMEDFISFDDENHANSKYVVLLDPLDGSSNIDVNVSVGTIFSIYRRVSPEGGPVKAADFLQPGRKQIAAGYVVYGSSTMLVFTTGHGVNGFTFDPGIGTFYLSHPNMTIPKDGKIYSINEGNYFDFPQGVKKYLKYCQEVDPDTGRPYSSRYIGSLVSDFHRNLLKGGIYIYPRGTNKPRGKLRLLYECNPMAFLAEQAGGKASNGYEPILDIQPEELHQRVPFFVGSENMVDKAESMMREYSEEEK